MASTKPKKPRKTKMPKPTVPDRPETTPPPRASQPRTISSPFYPAVTPAGGLPAATAEVKPSPAPPPSPPPPKMHKKAKAAASWVIQVAVVAIPAIITGYFSHISAKDDAETSYKTMVTAVGELQEATKELARQQAYLQGQLDGLRNETVRFHGNKVTAAKPRPPELKTEVTLSTLPSDLDSALKSKGKPMAQNVTSLTTPEVFSPSEKKTLEDAAAKRDQAVAEMEKKREELKREQEAKSTAKHP